MFTRVLVRINLRRTGELEKHLSVNALHRLLFVHVSCCQIRNSEARMPPKLFSGEQESNPKLSGQKRIITLNNTGNTSTPEVEPL